MKGNKLITRLVITFTILVTTLTCSCSSQKDTTESKINELKARVETVIVGYQDGTTIPLTKDSAQYERILDECLEAIVSIDEQCLHVERTDRVEQKWKPDNKYVQIDFDGPIVLVTQKKVDEDRFRVLNPVTIIFPLSDTDKGLMWLTRAEYTTYSVWENSQWSYHGLETLVDELRTLSDDDRCAIYAAVARQLYTVDHTFGDDPPNFPVVYLVGNTYSPMAADTDVDVKESVQAAVVAALADLRARFIWVENRDEVPLDVETRGVEGGGAIFTLGAIELQEDGTVHVTASLYFASLGGGGTTYVLERAGGGWQIVGRTGRSWIS